MSLSMATASAEPRGEPREVEQLSGEPILVYKVWILKVSLHCAACSAKVRRILKLIDGVYRTEADITLQKVTVVGNVQVETLIKRLYQKTGKHVELWPDQNPTSTVNTPSNDKPNNAPVETNHGGGAGGVDKRKGKQKEETVDVPKHLEVAGSTSKSKTKSVAEGIPGKSQDGRGVQINEPKPDNVPCQPPPEKAKDNGGGGEVGKDVQGQNGLDSVNADEAKHEESEEEVDEPAIIESVPIEQLPPVQVPDTRHHPAYQQLPPKLYPRPQYEQYYAPPPVLDGFGVNTSVHASQCQPPFTQFSSMYVQPELELPEEEPLVYRVEDYQAQPSVAAGPLPLPYYNSPAQPSRHPTPESDNLSPLYDSFALFSDENPTGYCTVM